MRTLASIQKICSLFSIPGADKIEVAGILGWQCVVKKGEFRVGDLVVYVEIDSIMPDRPEFEFLRERKFKVKTIKLRGQISQGLVLPLSVLPEFARIRYDEGRDVTDILGVTKYEEPEVSRSQHEKFVFPTWFPIWMRRVLVRRMPWLAAIIVSILPKAVKANTWPEFIPKTDETRVQSLTHILEKYAGLKCYVTEKLDGTSFTAFKHRGRFGVCSRNIELKSKDNPWWDMASESGLKNMLPEGVAVQGEIIGPGIQKNKYDLMRLQLRIFNGYDIKNRRYLTRDELINLCTKCGLNMVPSLGYIILPRTVEELVAMSCGESVFSHTPREGIVIRPVEDVYEEFRSGKFQGGRISFKVINPNFLLKHDL